MTAGRVNRVFLQIGFFQREIAEFHDLLSERDPNILGKKRKTFQTKPHEGREADL